MVFRYFYAAVLLLACLMATSCNESATASDSDVAANSHNTGLPPQSINIAQAGGSAVAANPSVRTIVVYLMDTTTSNDIPVPDWEVLSETERNERQIENATHWMANTLGNGPPNTLYLIVQFSADECYPIYIGDAQLFRAEDATPRFDLKTHGTDFQPSADYINRFLDLQAQSYARLVVYIMSDLHVDAVGKKKPTPLTTELHGVRGLTPSTPFTRLLTNNKLTHLVLDRAAVDEALRLREAMRRNRPSVQLSVTVEHEQSPAPRPTALVAATVGQGGVRCSR